MAQSKLIAYYSSPVGKKVFTGITGLGWFLFAIVHMIGNLSYFSSDPDAYNKYSDFLMSLGPLLYAVEIGLLVFLLIHAALGINIYLSKRKARKTGYAKYASKGGAQTRQSWSSRTMIWTGLILLIFIVVHLFSFKYGTYYEVMVDGEPMRDIKRLVTEKFQSPLYAFGYTAVMLLLAFHLRHGIWSAFQSLSLVNPRLTPVVYAAGGILGLLLAIGFFVLPLYIYFTGGLP